MNSFACGYCGASQVVERRGGTVSLKLLTDSITKVQVGTDKTAAELAIRRLKEELEEAKAPLPKIEEKRAEEINFLGTISGFLWFVGTAICIGIGYQNIVFGIFAFILWLGISSATIVVYIKKLQGIKQKHTAIKQKATDKIKRIQQKIFENKQIVDHVK